MNVVLTQLREQFGIPKGVMHYIVHQVRPRPPPIEEWEKWRMTAENDVFQYWIWYSVFLSRTQHSPRYDAALDIDKIPVCNYCNDPVNPDYPTCDPCTAALKE